MTIPDVYASTAGLDAVVQSPGQRGSASCVQAEDAYFVTSVIDQNGSQIAGASAEVPAWVGAADDMRTVTLPWVRVPAEVFASLGKGELAPEDLNQLPLDEGDWPLPLDEPVIVLLDGLPLAAVIEVSGSRVRHQLVEPIGRVTPQSGDLEAPQGRTWVVGAGAIGSHLATMLPAWGFRQLGVLDRDRLSLANIATHACGPGSVGRSKAKAVAAAVNQRFAGAHTVGVKIDLRFVADEFRGILDPAPPLIVAVDDPVSRQLCNHIAVHAGVPAVFVAMYRRGLITEVISYTPGGPCLNCVRLRLPMEIPSSGTADASPSTYRAGLRGDVEAAAGLAARVVASMTYSAVADLSSLPGPVLYTSAVSMNDLTPPWSFDVPGQANWVPMSAHRDCRVCGSRTTSLDKQLDAATALLASEHE